MMDVDVVWNGIVRKEVDEQVEWLCWKVVEERKCIFYVVFIFFSFLVLVYNYILVLINFEIYFDLFCDEEFFVVEFVSVFQLKGGVFVVNCNCMMFYEVLGELFCINEKEQKNLVFKNVYQLFGIVVNINDLFQSNLKFSSFGCLILINVLYNYIWEMCQ